MNRGLSSVCLLSLVFLSACVIVVDRLPSKEDSWMPRATFERTLPMKQGEEISLENARGNIEVRGWDEEKLEVRAEEGKETSSPRRLRFYSWKQADLEVEVESFPGGIRIRTAPRVQEDKWRSVHYVLRVPRSVHLRSLRNGLGDIRVADIYGSIAIEGEGGNITVENFSGSLDIKLGRGDVEAEVLDVRPEDQIRIATERGHIRLYLDPQALINLEAKAPEGSVVSDFDLKPELEPGAKALVSLRALGGDIWVKKGIE